MQEKIIVRGAKENNLKNVEVKEKIDEFLKELSNFLENNSKLNISNQSTKYSKYWDYLSIFYIYVIIFSTCELSTISISLISSPEIPRPWWKQDKSIFLPFIRISIFPLRYTKLGV